MRRAGDAHALKACHQLIRSTNVLESLAGEEVKITAACHAPLVRQLLLLLPRGPDRHLKVPRLSAMLHLCLGQSQPWLKEWHSLLLLRGLRLPWLLRGRHR